ncbi:hypothetical protein C0992_005055 [Termitomyces sp. T32_za158]|nr:hypothetical protein C0992_005055 [Termitomyces sp. T32_za158]
MSLHPVIVDLFLRQLEIPPLLTDVPLTKGIKKLYSCIFQDRINMALLGIQGLFIAVTTDLEFSKTLLPSWSTIWRWMDFLYHLIPCPGRDATKEPSHDERIALYLVERLLTAFFHPSCPIGREVLSTKGILQLTAEMYIRQGVCPPDPDVLPKHHLASLSYALQTLLESPFSNKQELIDFLNSNDAEYAKRMINPVHQAAYGGASWMECYPYVADVYSALFIHATSVYESFPTEGIVSDVCHAFSYFTSLLFADAEAHEPQSHRFTIECVTASLKLLVTYRLVAQGHSWIVQLLRFNFVLSLLKGAHQWDANIKKQCEFLLREIAVHSVFLVVLKPAGKVLESKDILSLEKKIPKNSGFFSVWTYWRQSMRHLQDCKTEFIRLGRYQRICGYPEAIPAASIADGTDIRFDKICVK